MRLETFFAAMLLMMVPAVVHAAPLDVKHLPADATWVFHFDVDAARETKTFKGVMTEALKHAGTAKSIELLEKAAGAKFPGDLKGITIYGIGSDDKTRVSVFHAKVDRAHLEDAAKARDHFESNPHGGHAILSWRDGDQTKFGAFADDQTIIIAMTESAAEAALDVMDGKVEAVKSDSPLLTGLKDGQVVYAGSADSKVFGAPDGQSGALSGLKSGWIGLTEGDDRALLEIHLMTKDAAAAKDLKEMVDAVKGQAVQMAAGMDDRFMKAVAAEMDCYASSQAGSEVVVSLPSTPETLAEFISTGLEFPRK
jgi:hypothetical protein